MGRYTYNSSVVANAISELNDAIKSLANVTPEIQAGINTITNANGARAIDVDCSKLLKLQEIKVFQTDSFEDIEICKHIKEETTDLNSNEEVVKNDEE